MGFLDSSVQFLGAIWNLPGKTAENFVQRKNLFVFVFVFATSHNGQYNAGKGAGCLARAAIFFVFIFHRFLVPRV